MPTLARLGGLLAIFGLSGWYVVTNWGAFVAYKWQLAMLPLALVLALWCSYFVIMAVGWVLAVRRAGAKLGFTAGAGIWVSSMPARYLPGNVWHVAGRLYLARQSGVTADAVLLSSVIEQVLTVAGEVIIFLLALPFWPNLPTAGLVGPLVTVPFALIGLHPRVVALALRFAARLLHQQIVALPLGYQQLLPLLLWYVAAALVNGLAFFVLASALGAGDAPQLPLLAGGYLLARSIGFLSLLTPAGLGVREAVLAAVLSPYMPLTMATVAGLMARVLSTVAEALTVLAVNALIALRRRHFVAGAGL